MPLWLDLSWMALCLLSLCLQTGLILGSIREKPLIQTTLKDRANADLVLTYRACFVVSVVINTLVISGTKVHFIPAFVLGLFIDYLATLFVMYLSVGAIVQGRHFKKTLFSHNFFLISLLVEYFWQ